MQHQTGISQLYFSQRFMYSVLFLSIFYICVSREISISILLLITRHRNLKPGHKGLYFFGHEYRILNDSKSVQWSFFFQNFVLALKHCKQLSLKEERKDLYRCPQIPVISQILISFCTDMLGFMAGFHKESCMLVLQLLCVLCHMYQMFLCWRIGPWEM